MHRTIQFLLLAATLLAFQLDHRLLGQSAIITAAGPVNRSMGGASVAAPIDSIGAIYWNPASISGMERSEISFGLGILSPNHTVSSSIGGFGGTTEADTGTFPVPNFGWVHRAENSRVTYGLGVNTVAGFGTNLPSDPSNPVLAPPAMGGLGRVSSNAMFLQVAPVVSYALRENFSVAAGPTITTARISLEPFVFGDANVNGYSPAQATRYHWGGGFQLGSYYIHDDSWRFGASFKSPTWMETFTANGQDAVGGPRRLSADVDLPMIVSVGTSFAGCEDWLLALDLRYLDFKNADGFGDPSEFDGTRLQGLGQGGVMAVALGVQRTVSDHLTVRGGYSYNENPTKNSQAFYNLATPLIYQHILSTGASVNCTDRLSFNFAYSYYFENTRSGQIESPFGTVPTSSVENTLDAHSFSFGLTVRH